LDKKIDFKFDALRTEMHTKFKPARTKIQAVHTELRITLGVILAIFITIGIKLIF